MLKNARLTLVAISLLTGTFLFSGSSLAMAEGQGQQMRTAMSHDRNEREEEFGPFRSCREAERKIHELERSRWHCDDPEQRDDGKWYFWARKRSR